jgi:hypothetical protein
VVQLKLYADGAFFMELPDEDWEILVQFARDAPDKATLSRTLQYECAYEQPTAMMLAVLAWRER